MIEMYPHNASIPFWELEKKSCFLANQIDNTAPVMEKWSGGHLFHMFVFYGVWDFNL